jgi:hypothetical protein
MWRSSPFWGALVFEMELLCGCGSFYEQNIRGTIADNNDRYSLCG